MSRRFSRLRAVVALAIIAGGLTVIGGQSASGLPDQNGVNNYAGPLSCDENAPGNAHMTHGGVSQGVVFFDVCGPATNVFEQESRGGTGRNVYEASGSGTGGTVTQKNGSGDNILVCVLSESVEGSNTTTNQSCPFAQNTTNGGNNLVVADLQATHFFEDFAGLAMLKQEARIALTGTQTATLLGDNTVSGPGGVPGPDGAPVQMKTRQTLKSEPADNVPPNQIQERLTNLDIDQFAASGDNSVNYNLDSFQSANADGLRPTQRQDTRDDGTSDPNARAVVHQNSVSGTNYQKGRGIDDKYERARSVDSALPGGFATQHQWHPNGGFYIEGDQFSANNPSGGRIDFGQRFDEGADCRTAVTGFKKLGVIETFDLFGEPTNAGVRSQQDRLPTIPGLPKSPDTATVGACSDLRAPAGTQQTALVSVDGHTRTGITGSIAAKVTSGSQTHSEYVPFQDQTVQKEISCTSEGCTTTGGGVTGSGDNVSATAGRQFTAQVAHFTNDDPSRPVQSAEIDWDENDAAPPAGGTIGGNGNPFTVTGTHTYANPGTYPIVVKVFYGDGSLAAKMRATATVTRMTVGIAIFGSNPNEGVQPVAIITTPDFDALTVKAESLRFGDCGDPPSTLATEVHGQVHPTDIAPQDGDQDGMTHFAPAAMMLEPDERTACLYGETQDGTKIFATGTLPKK